VFAPPFGLSAADSLSGKGIVACLASRIILAEKTWFVNNYFRGNPGFFREKSSARSRTLLDSITVIRRIVIR
jgi:hypothetical protein